MPVDKPRNEYREFKIGDLVRRYDKEDYVDIFTPLERGIGIVIRAEYAGKGFIEVFWRDTNDSTWFGTHMADEALILVESEKIAETPNK